MLGLALRIGLGDERAAQPITDVNQAKETLALAHTHRVPDVPLATRAVGLRRRLAPCHAPLRSQSSKFVK